jgi:hypothetical protein
MKKNRLLIIFMLLISCSNHQIDFDYVQIIPQVEEKKYRFSDYDQHYEMNATDIKEAEQILYNAVKEHQNEYTLTLTPETLGGFKRQYVAYFNQKGEKIIWINGFCDVLDIPTEIALGEFEMKPFDWKAKILDVDDGGDCYWQIMINMDTREYKLRVNGI